MSTVRLILAPYTGQPHRMSLTTPYPSYRFELKRSPSRPEALFAGPSTADPIFGTPESRRRQQQTRPPPHSSNKGGADYHYQTAAAVRRAVEERRQQPSISFRTATSGGTSTTAPPAVPHCVVEESSLMTAGGYQPFCSSQASLSDVLAQYAQRHPAAGVRVNESSVYRSRSRNDAEETRMSDFPAASTDYASHHYQDPSLSPTPGRPAADPREQEQLVAVVPPQEQASERGGVDDRAPPLQNCRSTSASPLPASSDLSMTVKWLRYLITRMGGGGPSFPSVDTERVKDNWLVVTPRHRSLSPSGSRARTTSSVYPPPPPRPAAVHARDALEAWVGSLHGARSASGEDQQAEYLRWQVTKALSALLNEVMAELTEVHGRGAGPSQTITTTTAATNPATHRGEVTEVTPDVASLQQQLQLAQLELKTLKEATHNDTRKAEVLERSIALLQREQTYTSHTSSSVRRGAQRQAKRGTGRDVLQWNDSGVDEVEDEVSAGRAPSHPAGRRGAGSDRAVAHSSPAEPASHTHTAVLTERLSASVKRITEMERDVMAVERENAALRGTIGQLRESLAQHRAALDVALSSTTVDDEMRRHINMILGSDELAHPPN